MTGHLKHRDPRRVLLILFLLAVAVGGSFGQDTSDYRLNKYFLKSLLSDFSAVVTSPFHWHDRDLVRFALATGGTAVCVAFDKKIMTWAQSSANQTDFTEDLSNVFQKVGNGAYLLGFGAALYAAGEIGRSRGLRKTALLSFESLATSSAIVWVVKVVVGRARPRTGHNFYKFHPFTLRNEYNAFPSGHTAAAFAVATTIADQAHSVPLDILLYGAATLVGYSRLHDNQHWASSVFGGAALGYFVAKKIDRRHRDAPTGKAADLGFAFGPGRLALTLTYAF